MIIFLFIFMSGQIRNKIKHYCVLVKKPNDTFDDLFIFMSGLIHSITG
jgi:hypothetical protein